MASDFFEVNNYFVDLRNGSHEYSPIYNNRRERIGLIKQKLNIGQKILRLLIGKTMLPFFVEIKSANGGVEASISRQGLFLSSDIVVQNGYNKKLGVICKKLFRPEFKILNTSNEVIAQIRHARKEHGFVVYDAEEKKIGSIDKSNRNESMEAFLKSRNSYNVNIVTHDSNDEDTIAILSSALVINRFF